MNESENPTSTNETECAELREEVSSLRFMLSSSLLLSFVFSFFIFVHLRSQNSGLSAQLQQQQNMVSATVPVAMEIYNRLGEYARTHPDYQPIYQKYSQRLAVPANPPAKK